MPLNVKALGSALGIFSGVFAFILVAISVATGYAKDFLMLVGPVHPWFSWSFSGAIWMGVLHLICGYIIGYLFARVYNRLA